METCSPFAQGDVGEGGEEGGLHTCVCGDMAEDHMPLAVPSS